MSNTPSTETAMKAVGRQARLELSGGSTPDLLRPPCASTGSARSDNGQRKGRGMSQSSPYVA